MVVGNVCHLGREVQAPVRLDLQACHLGGFAGAVSHLAGGPSQAEYRGAGAGGGRSQARAEQRDALGYRRQLVAELSEAGGELLEIGLRRRFLDRLECLLAGIAERPQLSLDRITAFEGNALSDCVLSHRSVSLSLVYGSP